MAPGNGRSCRALGVLLAGLSIILSSADSSEDEFVACRALVVIEGSQGDLDAQQALEGVQMGIMKSSNADLKDKFDDVNFLFLEMDKGDLFENSLEVLLPWVRRHMELLRPLAVLSLGDRAAALVDTVMAELGSVKRPNWHYKCMQQACPGAATGLATHETCVDFAPEPRDALREAGRLKPEVSKVLLLNDGSAVARRLAEGLAALSDRGRLPCSGCSVEERPVTSAADIRSQGPTPADANRTFMLLPSMAGLNATAAEVWAALRATQAGAFAPLEVVKLGGLAAFSMHPGSAAEECSVVIAQKGSWVTMPTYENKTSHTYKITMNMQRAESVQGIEWYNGNLHHSGREMWEPVQLMWPGAPGVPVQKPKVLIVHSYGRAYPFADMEHKGFIKGLQDAGHTVNCLTGLHSCSGDFQVRTLYWHTKFWFQSLSDIKVKANYTKEYIRRWRPDVVFFTDDDVLNHLVIPCKEPLTRGPNPSYDACGGTQYVGSGINGDVRRIFRDTCLEYNMDGTCARDPFFIEAGHSVACGDCRVGDEPECRQCADLYDKARPVNITLHLESPDTTLLVRLIHRVKPIARKVVIFSDDTVTSQGWHDTIKRQFSDMRRKHMDANITMDFVNDWHMLTSKDDFLAKVLAYQDKPEYMVWIPSTLAFLPMDPGARKLFWDKFLEVNKLGEVLAPGETDGALLGAAGHPDSMGRVCAQYASLILRGSAQASKLPILTTPLSKVFANVGRAMQLQGHGVEPIPDDVLARADHIFTLCPPGKHLKEGRCIPCPAQSYKNTYGDSQLLCLACPHASPSKTGLTSCPAKPHTIQRTNDIPWVVGIVVVTLLVVVLVIVTWQLKKRANGVWIIDERELDFGSGPVTVLGQGTFGKVVKAEYRGTLVAVKRVLPSQKESGRFDWENKTVAFERNITGCSSPSLGSYSYEDAHNPSGASDPSDLEEGLGRVRFNFADGTHDIPMNEPSGFRTVRRLKQPSSSRFSETFATWRQHQRLRKDFINEMRIVSQLRHPCVTTVMGAVMSSSAEPALVMELMENGSLHGMLHNDTVVIENEMALPILCDIAQGIRFLHAANPVIVHGDIKSQNVLLDAKFRAKVCDFGLSQKKQIGACGTPFWMAPELLKGGCISPASDVYAFGILLNEVCTRADPYAGEDPRQVLAAVVKDNKRPAIPEKCCTNMQVLMTECWRANPDARPPSQELDQRLRRFMDMDTSSPLACLAPPCRSQQRAYNADCDRTKTLLYDVFPKNVADQLRSGKKVEPESREIVTIFFSDIVGFTDISSTIEPRKISHMLDRLYTKFDALSREHRVFKVETIGDAYMAVSNLAEDQEKDHAKRIAQFALAAVEAANQTLIDEDDPSKGFINIRVGFHSGPVVANVVGTRNLRYCLFGDTVNTSSRMESNSIKNHIHCSAWAAHILREQAPEIRLIRRGVINVKGKGEMETFWVGKAPPAYLTRTASI